MPDFTATNIALIDEVHCIGCSKCIHACPVDAIFGAAKYMHTVIASECISCNLCVPACPVDCITLVPSPIPLGPAAKQVRSKQARKRVRTRLLRLQTPFTPLVSSALRDKKADIAAAIARAHAKRTV